VPVAVTIVLDTIYDAPAVPPETFAVAVVLVFEFETIVSPPPVHEDVLIVSLPCEVNHADQSIA